MPATINIAIFILGAVLLLIGLTGGAFKLFGAEISGKVGPGIRVACGLLGTGLLIWGGIRETHPSATAANAPFEPPVRINPAPIEAAAVPMHREAAAVETRSSPAPTPAILDVSGTWRDETGTVYTIIQRGGTFEFDASNSTTNATASGTGILQGQQWQTTFQTNLSSTGAGSGTLTADGTVMTGTFRDTRFGIYSRTITRVR